MTAFRFARSGFSVRPILALIVAIAVLPPLLFAGVAISSYANSERERAERGLIDSARGVARSIDGEFSKAVTGLTALTASTFLMEGELDRFDARLRNTDLPDGHGFALFDATGAPLVNTSALSTNRLLELGPIAANHFANGSNVYISKVLTDHRLDEPFAFVAVPVFSANDIRYVLGTFLSSSDFADVLRDPGVPGEWIVSLVDPDGVHFRRSHLNEQFMGVPLVPELVDHMAKGGTGTIRTVSHERLDLISTVAYAPRSGWAAAVGLPVAVLEAPFRETVRTLLITGVVAVALAVVLAFLMAGALGRGFDTMRRAAEALGRGEIISEMPSSSIREVNLAVSAMHDVSRTLVDRTAELNRLNSSLESEVAARTSALVEEMARREESEAQLRQLQKIEAIGQLTGGIAHDFNNMLAVVISGINIAKRRISRGDSNVEEMLDAAMQGAESAALLTRQLLAFARQQALEPEVLDANKFLAEMTNVLRRTIPENIEVETVAAGGLWPATVDVPGLQNCVLNLAVNARDAMPEGGKLTIETANAHLDEAYARQHADVRSGQYVLIAVTDTGTGMDAETREKAFDPFYSTKPTGQGTGLGLSQVFGFIKQSGGHVAIYSEVGNGTTVKLYLPRSTSDEARHVHPLAELPGSTKDIQDKTILVVEDDDAVRRSTVAMLEELGCVPLTASDGETALALLSSTESVDLVLTDVVMPGMNGRQLATEIVKRFPNLPILFTTGYTRNAIVHHGILDSDVDLINKPFTIDALATKLQEMLSHR